MISTKFLHVCCMVILVTIHLVCGAPCGESGDAKVVKSKADVPDEDNVTNVKRYPNVPDEPPPESTSEGFVSQLRLTPPPMIISGMKLKPVKSPSGDELIDEGDIKLSGNRS